MSITPLGSPVLPLEKITVARSSMDLGWAAGECAFSIQRAGQEPQQQRDDFFAKLRRGGGFFEQDCLAGDLQRNMVEQELGGDHGFELALRGAGGERFARKRVVQIHRNFAREHCREIYQRARNRRRQQDADHLLAFPRGCAGGAREKSS